MSKQSIEKYREVIGRILSDKPVAYHPDLARAFGGVKNAVMLSQLIYWTFNPTTQKREGKWFYKSAAEFETETGLTANEQATARRDLTEAGAIECDRKGIPPRVWYRVTNGFVDKLAAYYQTGERFIPKRKTAPNEAQKRDEASGQFAKKDPSYSPTSSVIDSPTSSVNDDPQRRSIYRRVPGEYIQEI
jgi:hypothetical protein